MSDHYRILALAAIAVVLFSLLPSTVGIVCADSVPSATGIDLTIDFENGTILNFSGLNGTNVLNITASVIDVESQWSGNLAFVTAIGGVSQDESHWWQYWVNGEYASLAVNWYNLEDGDLIEWKRSSSRYTGTESQDFDYSLVIGGIVLFSGGIVFLLLMYYRTSRRNGTS